MEFPPKRNREEEPLEGQQYRRSFEGLGGDLEEMMEMEVRQKEQQKGEETLAKGLVSSLRKSEKLRDPRGSCRGWCSKSGDQQPVWRRVAGVPYSLPSPRFLQLVPAENWQSHKCCSVPPSKMPGTAHELGKCLEPAACSLLLG